jgi:uncharacterized protein (TIGR03435 family)
MKGKRDVDRMLDRELARYAAPPAERMHLGIDRVRGRLRSGIADNVDDNSTGVDLTPRRARSRSLLFAAAAVLFLAAAGILSRMQLASKGEAPAVVEVGESSIYLVADGQAQPLQANARVAFREIVRSNGGAGSMLRLADGSRVEMRSESELTLERADDGVRIRLGKGGLIVNAAKQRTGHLYVQTKDVTVSVVGTVFLVNAEEQGSRVAVIEGEVRVQQGVTEQKLRPGEQITTDRSRPSSPVTEAIAWSRNAEGLRALLQQAAVAAALPAPQTPPPAKPAFEVISIRSAGAAPAGGGRGAGGLPSYAPYTIACSGVNFAQLDPGRLSINYVTLLTLILRAYGPADRNCTSFTSQAQGLTGGPAWVYSEQFNVEARIPQGTPSYTLRQLENNNAPVLQAMLRTALEDRFKLVVRRETKELPVEILKLGTTRDAAQLVELAAVTMSKSPNKAGFDGLFDRAAKGLETLKEGLVSTEGDGLWGINASMPEVVSYLGRLTGKPVLDRTGLMVNFSFHVMYDRVPDGLGAFQGYMRPLAPASIALLRRALREQLGLELESGTALVEVLVIERIERPTEN